MATPLFLNCTVPDGLPVPAYVTAAVTVSMSLYWTLAGDRVTAVVVEAAVMFAVVVAWC